MSELKSLCEQILLSPEEMDVKSKVEKVDVALCHVDELKNRVRNVRDALASGQKQEEIED